MIEIITAIAILCQVTGTTGKTYDEAKSQQKSCHKRLLTCLDDGKGELDYRLRNCVLKGGY